MIQHWLKSNQIPYLFSFVCLALIALMAFQINFLNEAKDLIEEQFDQKVNLAIGSTLSDFNAKHVTKLEMDDLLLNSTEESCTYIDIEKGTLTKTDKAELESNLSNYMSCFGIDEKYEIEIFDSACCVAQSGKSYCCAINPLDPNPDNYQLGVSFGSKEDYLFDRMKFMILSSILIFILLASVSFLILWSLIKQKRITANNIDFFNNTAHELKTPLTNISLALNLLGRKHAQIKEDQYAKIIKSENSKLKDQIERVLFLSRMENGEHKMKKEAIDLKILAKEVVDNMQMIIEEKEGSVELDLPFGELVVLGDPYHLSNVFRNLIDNALKYCNEKPVLKIQLKEIDDAVHVLFSDNGVGICKADQSHIFKKFQRVNTGDVREAKGFGIGLSYVKTVIEMHRGLINVQSELNKGSQFELIIPNK